MKRKKSNPELTELITKLRVLSNQENVNIWKRLAEDLEKPTRQRRIVNLSKIDRFTKEDEVVIVPGKVLASGNVGHKLTVGAYQFSKEAKNKLESGDISCFSIQEMMSKNPKGKNVKIIG